MSISYKTQEEIETLAEGGKRLARVMKELADSIKPGMTTDVLDARAKELLSQHGDSPAFLGYTPQGADRPYPASVCVSINEEIVHGIPTEQPRTIQEGDLVSLDMGLVHSDLVTDTAYTVAVGEVSEEAKRLLKATQEALEAGIAVVRAGNHVGDISAAVEAVGRSYDVAIFRELVGHGVGYGLHEQPHIPNVGTAGKGPELAAGMVIAIEPMFGLGNDRIKVLDDGYTYATADGSLSAHFEHTIVVTKEEPRVLTHLPS